MPAHSRLSLVVFRAGLALLGLAVGLGLAEVAFYLRDEGAFPHANFYLADPDLGVRLEPGATSRVRFPGNPVTRVRINDGGYRGPAWGAATEDEILIVGDSQVFGLGVEEDAPWRRPWASSPGAPPSTAASRPTGPWSTRLWCGRSWPRAGHAPWWWWCSTF